MPYVERRLGAIVGLFALPQPGTAEEFVQEGDAEVIAFRTRKPPDPDAAGVEAKIVGDAVLRALIRRTARKEGISERVLLDEIRNEVS